jgi:transcriptional regulator with XRE-family HTH domain
MKRVRLKIGDLLESRNLTQAQLSEMSGVRQAAISQLARGFISRISIDHLEKIANALEIDDIRELIDLVDENK